jgi:hypothetical protein
MGRAAEPRLATLRNRYRLDEVVGGCSTEFQRFRTLAFWVRGMWRTAARRAGDRATQAQASAAPNRKRQPTRVSQSMPVS